MLTEVEQALLLIDGQWRASTDAPTSFRAFDPSSGEAIGPCFPRSGRTDIERTLSVACAAAEALAACQPEQIASFLEAYADGIEAAADALVALAHAETALPKAPRLAAVELPRTTHQLRLAARAARESSWTQPVIDSANDLRALLAPLHKPVWVIGPNNFPFAFNAISGSDFASAIAARNPVIAKAHPAHPATTRALAQIALTALTEAGLPTASVQLLYDMDPALGMQLAADRRLGAVAFTGSRHAGLALKASADRAGVLFYGELSSVNPVFLLPGALAERGETLAQDYVGSCTLGGGQFCTNPGVVVLPDGAAADAFVVAASEHFRKAGPALLYSAGVQQQLQSAVAELRAAGAQLLVGNGLASGPGFRFAPCLLQVSGDDFLARAAELQGEAFGPVGLLLRAASVEQMVAIAARFDANLTGAIHAASDGSESAAFDRIAAPLRPRVGRLMANKWPTGVAVSPAMNHGGPYPASSHPGFTAVGMPAAIRRFAALHCFDQVPDASLPLELRRANPLGIQRLMDGQWRSDPG
jgi:NADP-dependent aldehyde dehydrogenase